MSWWRVAWFIAGISITIIAGPYKLAKLLINAASLVIALGVHWKNKPILTADIALKSINFHTPLQNATVPLYSLKDNKKLEDPEWNSDNSSKSVISYKLDYFNRTPVPSFNINVSFNTSLNEEIVRTVRARSISDGNLLGVSEPKDIKFINGTPIEKTYTFEFKNHQLNIQFIGRLDLKIQWECMHTNFAAGDESDENAWILMNVTEHVVYPLLKAPMRPWAENTNKKNEDFVFVIEEVLSLASKMANGKKSMEDVAKAITIYVNQSLKLRYDLEHGECVYALQDSFYLKNFLDALKREGTIKVNCSDCATITATYANALGCKLSEKIMSDIVLENGKIKGQKVVLFIMRWRC